MEKRADYARSTTKRCQRILPRRSKTRYAPQTLFRITEWNRIFGTIYSKETKWPNNIFSRAAYIGYFWAGIAIRDGIYENKNEMFGHKALARTLFLFLQKEGAELSPDSDRYMFFNDVGAITKENNLQLPQTFKRLQKVIAQHWMCEKNNHRKDFEDKLCHCPPASVRQKIIDISGSGKSDVGQPKEAEGN